MSVGKVAGSGGVAFDPRQANTATPLAPQEVGRERVQQERVSLIPQEEQERSIRELTDADVSRLVKRMAEMLNDSARWTQKKLLFKVHDGTGRMMVQVLDAETDEVLRVIPPEELLDLAARIHQVLGLFIDEWA